MQRIIFLYSYTFLKQSSKFYIDTQAVRLENNAGEQIGHVRQDRRLPSGGNAGVLADLMDDRIDLFGEGDNLLYGHDFWFEAQALEDNTHDDRSWNLEVFVVFDDDVDEVFILGFVNYFTTFEMNVLLLE